VICPADCESFFENAGRPMRDDTSSGEDYDCRLKRGTLANVPNGF
jgi:hypothetical protein